MSTRIHTAPLDTYPSHPYPAVALGDGIWVRGSINPLQGTAPEGQPIIVNTVIIEEAESFEAAAQQIPRIYQIVLDIASVITARIANKNDDFPLIVREPNHPILIPGTSRYQEEILFLSPDHDTHLPHGALIARLSELEGLGEGGWWAAYHSSREKRLGLTPSEDPTLL